MKYLRRPESGEVFAFAADGSDDAFIPADLVVMGAEEVAAHIAQVLPPLTRALVEAGRLRAYADPITGSDRYFAEAQRESLLGNAEAAEAAKALGLARFVEIQGEHPWPAE